jgi:hypothetical protein
MACTLTDADTTALLCDPATPLDVLAAAAPADALLALCAITYDSSLVTQPSSIDRLTGRTRSLFTPHPRAAALGELFYATLADPAAAVSACTALNETLGTWSILVDVVRRHLLTPAGPEATVEDVIAWLAPLPGGPAILERAVALALAVGDHGRLVSWLDSAWEHVSDTSLLITALADANVTHAPPIAVRLIELLDPDELYAVLCRLDRVASTAQTIFFATLAPAGLIPSLLANTSRASLDADLAVRHLTVAELTATSADPTAPDHLKRACARELRTRS